MSCDLTPELTAFASERRMVHIKRPFPGEPSRSGFILGVGEELVLFRQFHDFYPEGFAVFRVDDIEKIEYTEREKVIESIIKAESIIDFEANIWTSLSLDAFSILLNQVRELGCFLIVQCESREWEDDDEFVVGRIIASDDVGLTLKCVSTLAIWEKEEYTVFYSNITCVQLDAPYVNMLTKYVRE